VRRTPAGKSDRGHFSRRFVRSETVGGIPLFAR
jgi:hypothetical protein